MGLDFTHDMYLPDRRAPKASPERNPGAQPVAPRRDGSREEQEAWMRKRQEQRALAKVTIKKRRMPKFEGIFADVCRANSITRRQLLSKDRSRSVVQARARACRELRALGLSFPEIAAVLNLEHHTSVLHHCQKQPGPPTRPVEPSLPDIEPDWSGGWTI